MEPGNSDIQQSDVDRLLLAALLAPNQTALKACTRVISRPFSATQLLKTILLRGHLPRLSVTAKIVT